jgi:hypothetical protein
MRKLRKKIRQDEILFEGPGCRSEDNMDDVSCKRRDIRLYSTSLGYFVFFKAGILFTSRTN